MNYEPLVPPKPLDFGIAIHAGLQAYYDPLSWTSPVEERVLAAMGAFRLVCKEQKQSLMDVQQKVDLGIDLEEEFADRLDLGTKMLRHYGEWSPEQDKDWEPVKVEIEFEVPVLEPGGRVFYCPHCGEAVVYQGRVDLLVKIGDYYWIVDHKTAGQFASTEHLDLDEQCGSYGWALQHILGLKVHGVIYNELLKDFPRPPQMLQSGGLSVNRQQKTTASMYVRELDKLGLNQGPYLDFIQYLVDKGNKFFRRTQIHRSQAEYRILGERIYYEALDMVDPTLRLYPNPGRFNCMGCAYKPPCLARSEGGDEEYILNTLYRKRPDEELISVSND
jgi:hypothetical protein